MGRYSALVYCVLLCLSLGAQKLQFNKYGWHLYDTFNSPLPSLTVSNIKHDSEKNLWVTTPSSPLIKIVKGGIWEEVEKPDNYASNAIDSLNIPGVYEGLVKWNSKGVVLVGATNAGSRLGNLYQIEGSEIVSFFDSYGELLDIHIEKNGDALVAFKSGLYRYSMKRNGTYGNMPEMLSGDVYRKVLTDSKGVIWAICVNDGFLHRYDGRWRVYTTGPSALYCEYEGQTRYVARELLILSDGRIMISTRYNTGIAVFNGEAWKGYKPELSVPGDEINQMIEGPDGTIWCGTNMNGLAAFRPAVHYKPLKRRARTSDSLRVRARIEYIAEEEYKDVNSSRIDTVNRKRRTARTISTFEDSVMIRVWDSQKVDGDTISLLFNGTPFLLVHPLTATQDTFWLALTEGYNEILLYAHNLGSIPPNTATVVISMGNLILNAELNSDLETSERLMIRKRRKDGSAW